MAYKQQQAVSKPLLIILLVVALIGAFMLARNMMDSGGGDEKVEGVPEVPENLQPPVLPPNGPRPTTGGN
jgi:hypothetical protein